GRLGIRVVSRPDAGRDALRSSRRVRRFLRQRSRVARELARRSGGGRRRTACRPLLAAPIVDRASGRLAGLGIAVLNAFCRKPAWLDSAPWAWYDNAPF